MFSSTHRKLGLALIALSLTGTVGCKETTDSANIRTPGIAMLTEVTARSTSSSRVEVTLLVGGDESNTYVELTEGDVLIAEADGEEKTMEEVSEGVYDATFDIADEDTEFTVRLEREVDEDAVGNTGRLPAPFRITSDLGDEPYSRLTDDIELTWEPGSDDTMVIEVSDDESCIITSERFQVGDDDGAYRIEANEDDPPLGNNDEDTCDLTIDLIREREGFIDGALDRESTFFLRQVRSTTATSSP